MIRPRCWMMLMPCLILSVAGCAKSPAPSQAATGPATTQVAVDFEKYATGKAPPDFTAALTGGGGAMSWVVQEDASAPRGKKVLTQTSADNTDYRFPVCVYTGLMAKDVAVTVRFKAVAGKTDQAAGVVLRFRDKDNYYVVRANALEDNVRLYKVEGGRRKQFAGADTKVTSGEWHTLGLAVNGSHFWATFDGKPLFEADDQTFTEAGKVGIWTKADSVTSFDDIKIEGHDAK